MRYIQADNFGIGFITYDDSATFKVQGFPNNIWVTDDSAAAIEWAQRVNGTALSKDEATAIVNQNLEPMPILKGASSPPIVPIELP